MPGKELNIACHFSRPVILLTGQLQDGKDTEFQSKIQAFVNLVVNNLPASDKSLRVIQQHQENDHTFQKVKGTSDVIL